MRNLFLIVFLGWYARSDLRCREVPALPVPFLIAAGLILRYIDERPSFGQLIFGLIPGMLLMGLSLSERRWIGCGDALVFMVCGAFAGWNAALELLLLSLVFAGLWGLLILIRGGKKDTEFPFLPFVLAAALARLCAPPLP